MTPTADELRELADWLAAKYKRHGEDEDRRACDALRTLAEEKERAQAGITDAVVFAAMDAYLKKLGLRMADMHFDAMKAALQSAALALQPDREMLVALAPELRQIREYVLTLPHSLGFEYTAIPKIDAVLRALAPPSDGGT